MTHSPGSQGSPAKPHTRWAFYICGRKDRRGATACKSRRIGALNAERQIIDAALNQILTPEYLSEVLAETKRQLESTVEIERQITAEKRRLEDLEIAIQRTLNTIEKTGSQSAQERLKQREAEKAQVKVELERLTLQLTPSQMEITPEALDIILAAWRGQFDGLQESGNIRETKSWLMQFISRIELRYNQAKIFYTYPLTSMMDLLTGGNSRSAFSVRGGTQAKDALH